MPKILDKKVINERSRHLLKVLVERYIHDGQPVGSRTLSRDSSLNLSAATIRNIMADLEDIGLVRAPHTSAGRVPTVQGYRVFIDTLLQLQPLPEKEIAYLRGRLAQWEHEDDQDLLARTSGLLSELTHLAGVVMLPKRPTQILRHVEFLLLPGERRVLVVLVINEREVLNRVIHTSHCYSESELQQAANFLNEKFSGKDLREVQHRLNRDMETARARMNRVLQVVSEMAEKAFKRNEEGSDFVLSGQNKLLDMEELSSIEKLRDIFEIFTRKQEILELLDQALATKGIHTLVGEESGYQGLDVCSIVTSPYRVNGRVVGVLGVIGPTRMPYARVIPIVDTTARLLGFSLQQHFGKH